MNGTFVTTELYTLDDGRRVFAYHVGSASFYGYGYSLKEAWTEANTLFVNALAQIESEMDEPTPTCICGATLDADGECPRAVELDASIAAEAGEGDTEEYTSDILFWGNLRHSGIKWGLTGNEIRYTAENPLYDQPQPAPKEKLPRVFPDEVFMPDDYIPMDEY